MAYIKNIIKIEAAEAEKLKSVIFPARHLCILPQDVEFRQIQCKNPSSCEISDKVESKVRIFTSKLTFKSCEQINSDDIPLAYRVTTADGSPIPHRARPSPVSCPHSLRAYAELAHRQFTHCLYRYMV